MQYIILMTNQSRTGSGTYGIRSTVVADEEQRIGGQGDEYFSDTLRKIVATTIHGFNL